MTAQQELLEINTPAQSVAQIISNNKLLMDVAVDGNEIKKVTIGSYDSHQCFCKLRFYVKNDCRSQAVRVIQRR